MLINKGNGTFIGGPLDVLCILHDEKGGKYHACFAEEAQFPGPCVEVGELSAVRLKSKMHHTAGAATIEEARQHLADLRARIEVPEENVWSEPRAWDGQPFVTVVPNWRKKTA